MKDTTIQVFEFLDWTIEIFPDGENFRYRFQSPDDPGELFGGRDRFASSESALESAKHYLKGAAARLATMSVIEDFFEAGRIDSATYHTMINSVRL
jgi:hypothetical protein